MTVYECEADHAGTMSALSANAALQRIAELVAQRTGIAADQNQDALARITRQLAEDYGVSDLDSLAQRLEAGEHWDELIDRLTGRETYFFRNPEHFSFVADTVLPALGAQPLRIWSAGCASGEEPYSLAILLDRAGKLERASILGTDVSLAAIERARAGRYRESSLRAMQPELAQRYFRREADERVIREELRAHVSFRALSLLELGTPSAAFARGPFELIFCRNLLRYCDAESCARLELQLCDALAAGGFLIADPADPPLGRACELEVVQNERWVCYRKPVQGRQPTATPSAWPLSDLYDPSRRRRPSFAPEAFADAERAFERGEYERVIEIACRKPSDPRLALLTARATWNLYGPAEAVRCCVQVLRKHGLSAELHYLHAIALVECSRLDDALRAVRQALYLDRSLTVAHFAHASILERLQNVEGARRAYRSTYFACSKLSPDEALPLGDGIVAQGMANAAARALEELSTRSPADSARGNPTA